MGGIHSTDRRVQKVIKKTLIKNQKRIHLGVGGKLSKYNRSGLIEIFWFRKENIGGLLRTRQ